MFPVIPLLSKYLRIVQITNLMLGLRFLSGSEGELGLALSNTTVQKVLFNSFFPYFKPEFSFSMFPLLSPLVFAYCEGRDLMCV